MCRPTGPGLKTETTSFGPCRKYCRPSGGRVFLLALQSWRPYRRPLRVSEGRGSPRPVRPSRHRPAPARGDQRANVAQRREACFERPQTSGEGRVNRHGNSAVSHTRGHQLGRCLIETPQSETLGLNEDSLLLEGSSQNAPNPHLYYGLVSFSRVFHN